MRWSSTVAWPAPRANYPASTAGSCAAARWGTPCPWRRAPRPPPCAPSTPSSVLEVALGSLDRVERVLSVTGYVASTPGFHRQPDVVDGASSILAQVFGDSGRHTRSAVGVAALPRGGAVEIEVTVAVSP